jgi:hypothetical protein
MQAIGSFRLVAVVIGVVALAGCDAQTATVAPNASGVSNPSTAPGAVAAQPAILIDSTWKNANGQWTFTGHVDPQGDSTDVILEIGPGPATTRVFDNELPVARGLTVPSPLTITTGEIPDIPEICVRFSATNSSGTSVTSPLCFPHDLPSFVPDAGPPVTTFSAPATGSTAVIKVSTYTVAWTESGGAAITFRSLQRQVAIDTGSVCGAFADDGAALSAASPVAVTGLVTGHCYQWIETLRDHAGVTTVTTSGIVSVR